MLVHPSMQFLQFPLNSLSYPPLCHYTTSSLELLLLALQWHRSRMASPQNVVKANLLSTGNNELEMSANRNSNTVCLRKVLGRINAVL